MTEELKRSKNNYFVTLTLSDENLTWGSEHPSLVRRDVQLFMKRLRKLMINKVKFYAVGEYGSQTYRPHYHLIIFNTGIQDKDDFEWNVLKAWDKGLIHIGYVTEASIRYVAGYLEKDHNGNKVIENVQREFNQMSKGIGEYYVNNAKKYHKQNNKFEYSLGGGNFTALPRYYRKKIFDQDELDKYAREIAEDKKKLTAREIILKRTANENRLKALLTLKNKRK